MDAIDQLFTQAMPEKEEGKSSPKKQKKGLFVNH
jgi:hypothetical protein